MNDSFYKAIIDKSPIGYSYHKIILDMKGLPIDYEFIEVNAAFEKVTGLQAVDIVGKKITEVLPNIKNSVFNWIKCYGEIATKGGEEEFEQFSDVLNRWYKVKVFSPEYGFFITQCFDISYEKESILKVKNLEEEKSNRAEELVVANKEIAFQKEEKANRAEELVIANKELSFQKEEKANRAEELVGIQEEGIQNEEKIKLLEAWADETDELKRQHAKLLNFI